MQTPMFFSAALLAALAACGTQPDREQNAGEPEASGAVQADVGISAQAQAQRPSPVARALENRDLDAAPAAQQAPVRAEGTVGGPAPGVPAQPATVPDNPDIGLILGDGQLQVVIKRTGSTRTFPFGAPRAQVMTMLGNVRGGPPRAPSLTECTGGPMTAARWPDGLSVFFRAGELAGWRIDGGSALTTMTGIGLGSSLAEFQSDFDASPEHTPAGWEARAGGVTARFDGNAANASILALSSGAVCQQR